MVLSFWLQLLSVASRWCWTGSWRGFFCWSLRRRCLGLTGNTTASRTQPICKLKHQDLQGGGRKRQVRMRRDYIILMFIIYYILLHTD